MSNAEAPQLGRYQLVRKIATGGMAEVFLAKALGPGGFEKTLVVKRILPSLAEDPEFVDMFLHEARLAAQLNHPNVAQIFDFGEVDGTYYLAMEFVDGPNLRSVLRRAPEKKVPATLAARLITQACQGLAYAHEFADPSTGQPLGLIHRDVSADNLLVARNGTVKVVDFGVAKVEGQVSKTESGTVKGKIAYMPPEQILGEADHRADVYALGVILYEMAAGTRPYEQMPDVQLLTAIMKRDPTPLLVRAPDVPVGFAMVVDKAMARDVSARFQDCRELEHALEDFIDSTGERIGGLQVGQFVTSVMGNPVNAVSATNLRPVGAPATQASGALKSGTRAMGTPTGTAVTSPSGNFPAIAPVHGVGSGSGPRNIGLPSPSGSFPAVAPATSPSGNFPTAAPATSPSGNFPTVAPVTAPGSAPRQVGLPSPSGTFAAVPQSSRASGHYPAVGRGATPGAGFPAQGGLVSPSGGVYMPSPAPSGSVASLGTDLFADVPAPGEWSSALPASPLGMTPTPAPVAETTRVLPSQNQGSAAEARANAVLADCETMRTYEPGPPLAPAAELEALRADYERDETLNVLMRFGVHAARLLPANPHAPGVVAERVVGAIEGLLIAEAWAPLARLLERLQAASTLDANNQWVWSVARATFATAHQAQRLLERVREAAPSDPEAFGRCLGFFGGEYAEFFLQAAEQHDNPASRDALLHGLAELSREQPGPFLARLLEERPRRVADFAWLVEKGRTPDRQRAIRQVLGRRDPALRNEVLAGMARAGTDDACNLLTQALGDRTEAVRMQALELLGKHFPDRVFKFVEPMLEQTTYETRTGPERVAIWRAIGSSAQPEAYYCIADVLKQKPSLLNRGRVQALKLDALEGLALMKTAQGEELLKQVAADRSQPDVVMDAAARLASASAPGPTVDVSKYAGLESRRWDRTATTARGFLLDLSALAQAARLVEVGSPALDTAFLRLRLRLEGLLRRERRVQVAVSGKQMTLNGVIVIEGQPDLPMEQLASMMARYGAAGFALEALPQVAELRELVRWLAEGPGAEGIKTPLIQRLRTATTPELPPRPVTPAPDLADPSREAMVRYVDLIYALRAFLQAQRQDPRLRPADAKRTLDELAAAMQTRQTRFLGLTPSAVGREAVAFHHANVLVLSLGFAAELGLPLARLQALAEYAYLHDVGMYELSDETLLRAGDLTAGDKEALQRGRLSSAWYPFERLGASPRAASWAAAVVEYGLDWGVKDEAGKVTARQEVGLLGSILSLAKTFDALTSRRSFREAMTPEAALEVMTGKVNHRFRPELLPLFAAFVQRHRLRQLPGRR